MPCGDKVHSLSHTGFFYSNDNTRNRVGFHRSASSGDIPKARRSFQTGAGLLGAPPGVQFLFKPAAQYHACAALGR